MSTLVVDDLRFEVKRSDRRRSIEIMLGRAGELTVAAPPGVPEARIRDFVRRKRMWVYKQRARHEAVGRNAPRKVFTDGEGFLYLGRSYRLRLVADSDAALKLVAGRFVMPKGLARDGREHLIRWYCERGQLWLAQRVENYQVRMDVEPGGVKVRDLGFRWGSCGKGGALYFHWKAMLLPAHIADYIVVHEMAHLHEPHHTAEFWRRVERAMPDFDRRRRWLEAHGFEVEGH